MKYAAPHWLFALGLSLLTSCGTEIGNGRKPPSVPVRDYVTAGDKNTASEGNSPTAQPDATETGTTSTPAADESLKYLLIACGSPIPDLTAATFKDSIGSATVTITLPATNSWTLTLSTQTTSTNVTKNATATEPYGIASTTTTLGTQTCTGTTTTLNGALTEKQITYSDNYKTSWTVDGNAHVTEIKVQDGTGTLIRNWVLQ